MDIRQQKSWNILLVGDLCLDVYHYGICERMSPEAPIPVFKERRKETRLGMSGNVRLNLESFGLHVEHLHNQELIEKHRFVEERYNQQLFRCDQGESVLVEPLTPSINKHFDAVVISDYNKGSVTPATFRALKEKISPLTPVFVDSKKQDLRIFEDSFIKINDLEASRAITEQAQNVIVTLGSRGVLWGGQLFETEKVDVFDVCGAGDVFLSALTYGYLKYGNLPAAIAIANRCASLSVTKMGTYVLTKDDINDLCI